MAIVGRVENRKSPAESEICEVGGQLLVSGMPPFPADREGGIAGEEGVATRGGVAAEEGPAVQERGSLPLRGLHVLLVDDDEQACRFIGRYLSRAGADVKTARNGVEALALLEGGGFDLIVSDIHMPYMDGIELLSAVRARDAEVSFMIVTGEPKLDSALAALNQGVVSYLTKPIDTEELLTAAKKVRTHAALARVRRELVEATAATTLPPPSERQREFDLALEGLHMVFQPIVHFASGTVYAHEALVRTRYPGVPHPGAFFSLGEELGQVPRIGKMIRNACGEVLPNLPPDTLLFINLHMNEILDSEFLPLPDELCSHAERVVFEITERAEGRDIEAVAEQISTLRKAGFRIAIDDIGAGYAGLNSFAILEPDVVKLDMALVRGVDSSDTKQRLILALAELCHGMHINLIAEGVESAAEVDTLAALGIELFQGYYFARPGEGLLGQVARQT